MALSRQSPLVVQHARVVRGGDSPFHVCGAPSTNFGKISRHPSPLAPATFPVKFVLRASVTALVTDTPRNSASSVASACASVFLDISGTW